MAGDREVVDHYARRLATALAHAADHRHIVGALPWRQAAGEYAFAVKLCDSMDLPSGFTARVTVTVSDAREQPRVANGVDHREVDG